MMYYDVLGVLDVSFRGARPAVSPVFSLCAKLAIASYLAYRHESAINLLFGGKTLSQNVELFL